jgi:hypothetical protein
MVYEGAKVAFEIVIEGQRGRRKAPPDNPVREEIQIADTMVLDCFVASLLKRNKRVKH